MPHCLYRSPASCKTGTGRVNGFAPFLVAVCAAALLFAAPFAAPAFAQEASQNGSAEVDQVARTRAAAEEQQPANVVMVVHGGAGSIEEVNMTAEEEEAYRTQLTEALQAGYDIIEGGGSSVDAIEQSIKRLERSPLFNAGRGAVFTSAGMVEHDASIMEGRQRGAGAIAGTKHIEHPIEAARLVMEESRHVMLAREGAEEFALAHGMDLVPNSHFYTPDRRARFLRSLTNGVAAGSATSDSAMADSAASKETSGALLKEAPTKAPATLKARPAPRRHDQLGTVGAVARDQEGTLAAGTSTGGMSNKRWGRIGDSPIIGAGTYADNETAAVSSTGWGEYFIRGAVAHEITALMRHAGASLGEAARTAIIDELGQIGDGQGTGGVIALDAEGNAATPFTTPGMFRGWITEDGTVVIRFYSQDTYDGPADSE